MTRIKQVGWWLLFYTVLRIYCELYVWQLDAHFFSVREITASFFQSMCVVALLFIFERIHAYWFRPVEDEELKARILDAKRRVE